MTSWFIMINIVLLFSSSLVHARHREHSKRRYSTNGDSFAPFNLPNDNNFLSDIVDTQEGTNSEEEFSNDFIEPAVKSTPATTTTTTTAKTLLPSFQANEEQIEQFTRLLIDRLNLKEPPNVTVNVNDETGIPSTIIKQLEHQTHEQQRIQDLKEKQYYRQQKLHDEILPTAERAILPGDSIPNYTCQRQLSAKLNIADKNLQTIDCFRFAKSPKETKSLPTNQWIIQLRLYVQRNYFNWDDVKQPLTADMFHIYQVFRPTYNDTTHYPPPGLTDTTRLPIRQIKQLNDNWYELTIDSNSDHMNIQQIYKQLIMPWYGLAIDQNLYSSSSAMARSASTFNRPYHRQFHSRNHPFYPVRSSDSEDTTQDDNSKESQQHPYMLVEYGEKISSSSGRRGTRDAPARPARGCNPSSPCCRRSLIIDLDQGNNALSFVIYPRQIDIGECVGLCGTGGSSLKHTDVKNAQQNNEQNSAYNFLLLQNGLHRNRNGTILSNRAEHSSQCCSYSRTSGLEIMYATTNGGPIIHKLIPNMVVEECKCGLPATIQQV